MSYKTHVHGGRESSGDVLRTKRSNEGQGGPKGIVEGRPLVKEVYDSAGSLCTGIFSHTASCPSG